MVVGGGDEGKEPREFKFYKRFQDLTDHKYVQSQLIMYKSQNNKNEKTKAKKTRVGKGQGAMQTCPKVH
jgi:hypothetical protein